VRCVLLNIKCKVKHPKIYQKIAMIIVAISIIGFGCFKLILSNEIISTQKQQVDRMADYFDTYYSTKCLQLMESTAESSRVIGEVVKDQIRMNQYSISNFKTYIKPILINSSDKCGVMVLYKTNEYTISDYFYKENSEIKYEPIKSEKVTQYITGQKGHLFKLYPPSIYNVGNKERILGSTAYDIDSGSQVLGEGLVAVDYVSDFFNQLLDEIKIYSDCEAVMVSSSGNIVATADKTSIGKPLKQENPKLDSEFSDLLKSGKLGTIVEGDQYFMIIKPIQSQMLSEKWYVIFKVMKSSTGFVDSALIQKMTFIWVGFGLIMMLIIIASIVHELSPINDILLVLRKADQGYIKQRINIQSRSDLSSIADATNKLLDKVELSYIEKERQFMNTITTLASAIDAKDHYTGGHSDRVALYSKAIAEAYGLGDKEIADIYVGATLHDIGKISIPDHIISKTEQLTNEEYERIQQHPKSGYLMVQDLDFLGSARQIILHHHEKYSGKGYPDGLKADSINIGSRIVAVADSFDAITSFRTYRKTLTQEEAVNEIVRHSGTQFDPMAVEAFLKCIENETINIKIHLENILECRSN
jgi:HD-GYP domain-containing protein (c-di-GMP phosphodiesterase class II)